MDWLTVIFSGLLSAIVSGLFNYRTQIQAIKESGLYSKRAKILDKFVTKLEVLDSEINDLLPVFLDIKSIDHDKTRRKLIESLSKFSYFYKGNKHYLSSKIANKIDKLTNKQFDICIETEERDKNSHNKEDKEIFENYFFELTKMKEDIIGDFRNIIGIK